MEERKQRSHTPSPKTSPVSRLLLVVVGNALSIYLHQEMEARWRSGRASDSELKGPGFDPHRRHHVVSLSKTH